MLDALRRPIPLRLLLAGVGLAALLVALYCLGYTKLAGRPETFAQSIGWALTNVCPWLLAIEGGKHARNLAGVIAMLAAALLASVALGFMFGANWSDIVFDLWRRLPALAVVAALVTLLRSGLARGRQATGDIPLLPRQIDWVRAAGNYVELRAGGRIIVHRASISAAERDLAAHGFVRIHRSTLVRRDRIARVRPNDVVLHDGTHLPVGKRYRAILVS